MSDRTRARFVRCGATHQRCEGISRAALLLWLAFVPGLLHSAPLKIATLSTVLTEFAVRVGGDAVRVTGLIPPGVDPHTFEPSPRDLAALQNSDLILAAGIDLDPGLLKAVANAGGQSATVNLSLAPDPHWWNSVPATESVVRRLTAELEHVRPAAARGFAQRSAAVLAALDELDQELRSSLSVLPPSHRVLVTTHDAFAWFARDYGFRVYSLTGINPEGEPNARDLARIVDVIRDSGVKTIFFESAAGPRLVSALSEETGCRVGGALYADGLSPDGEGATYAGMMRHNISTLVDGLK